MKNKLEINQPKYIIPLIVLPFLFFGYYIYGNLKPKYNLKDELLMETEGINTIIPEASLSGKTKNKLEAFRDALRTSRKNTAIEEIGLDEEDQIKNELQDSIKKAIHIDSIKQAYEAAIAKRNKATKQAELSRQRLHDIATGKMISKTESSNTSLNLGQNYTDGLKKKNTKPMNKAEREMDAFKKQMLFIDSIANPEKYKRLKAMKEAEVKRETITEKESGNHKLTKEKTPTGNYFNTIKANNDEIFITALLDEGIKVWEGSRVRIRLLEEVFIDGHLLKKGEYLYGIVKGFKQQRVEIEITSIIVSDEILPVKISLYDNDGIQGIYVPDSSFRDFTKELGQQATNDAGSISLEGNSQNSSELLYKSISSSFKTSTKAIQKALKNNKAKLKYNTQVYLVNSK